MDRDTRSRVIAELRARVLGESAPEHGKRIQREIERRVRRHRSESLDDLSELSNATLRSYRKKAKGDQHRWIGRAIAKAKMTGERDPDASDETNVRIRGTGKGRRSVARR